ncbi:MAG: hypothetical protein ABSG65_03460 [Bryobacteraceae bacterium]
MCRRQPEDKLAQKPPMCWRAGIRYRIFQIEFIIFGLVFFGLSLYGLYQVVKHEFGF